MLTNLNNNLPFYKEVYNAKKGDTVFALCSKELSWGRIIHRGYTVADCVEKLLNELKATNQIPVFYQKTNDTSTRSVQA